MIGFIVHMYNKMSDGKTLTIPLFKRRIVIKPCPIEHKFPINERGITPEVIIDKDGAYAAIYRGWYNSKQSLLLCEELKNTAPWHIRYTRGKAEKRRVFSCGDTGISVHWYSRAGTPTHPWLPEVEKIRNLIEEDFAYRFNSQLGNEFADGEVALGAHSDQDALGFNNLVATVSLGDTRDFVFRSKLPDEKGEFTRIVTPLHNGDLTIMLGKCQELWTHAIPMRKRAQYRISLTYRTIATDEERKKIRPKQ